MSNLYNPDYYKSYLGTDYEDSSIWTHHFGIVADRIVMDFHPTTVLDAGCAWGYLVAALRDRGVEAYGLDISDYAISRVREDIKPYCKVGSLTEALPEEYPKHFDLIVNIEVLEHMHEEEGLRALANLCAHTDQILFSSTPDDISEETHYNVQQPEYWMRHFATQGFYHEVTYRPDYISPAAVHLRRMNDVVKLVEDYERWHRQTVLKLTKPSPKEWISNLYFDNGSGIRDADKYTRPVKSDCIYDETFDLDGNVQRLRFDPVEFNSCIVQNLEVLTDQGLLPANNSNGIRMGNMDFFANTDPMFDINLSGKQLYRIRIRAEIHVLEGTSIPFLLSRVEEHIRAVEKKNAYQEDISQQNEKLKQYIQELNDFVDNERRSYEKQLQECNQTLTNERGQKDNYIAAYNSIANARWWKITKPFRVLTRCLKWFLRKIFHNALTRSGKKLFVSYRQNGIRITIKKVLYKISGRTYLSPQSINVGDSVLSVQQPSLSHTLSNVQDFKITNNPIHRIPTIIRDEIVHRINFVTDSIAEDSLLGGVATALIIATKFALKFDYELRIITRTNLVNPMDYENIIKISGIEIPQKVSYYSDFNYSTKNNNYRMDITPNDIFIATSWWSAEAIKKTTLRKSFFYIIQEVESFFYTSGAEQYLCSRIMHDKNAKYIVNSHYLYEYFKENEPNIVENGIAFEPAFPTSLYKPKALHKKNKYRLFFYARPNNPRNMFAYGIEMIERAIASGILNTNVWDIYFAGQPVGAITFSNGYTAKDMGRLSWQEYGEFLSDIDLAISLMFTPHPSYPPYDVVCSGGVVITNTFMNKTSFEQCKNVIMSDLEEEKFLQSIAQGVALAKDLDARKTNYDTATIPRDWSTTLMTTLDFMGENV